MAVYKPHCLTIHVDGSSAVHLPDMINMAVNISPELLAELVADQNSPKHVAYVARKVLANFNTFSIATALSTIGVKGVGIVTTSNPGVTLFAQKYDDNSDPVSGGVHRSFAFKGGVIVPKTLTCQHGQDARLTVDIVPVKYSSNAIITESDTASLPSITVASGRWTLGSCVVGGVSLTEYDSLEIDFGNNIETRGSQSDVDPVHIEQRTFEPTITLKGIDPTWFKSSNIPLSGKAATHAADKIHLRKRAQDDTHFVSNGTSSHIKFTIGGMAAIDNAFTAEAQRISETSLMIKMAIDGSGNAPLIVNTAATIS